MGMAVPSSQSSYVLLINSKDKLRKPATLGSEFRLVERNRLDSGAYALGL